MTGEQRQHPLREADLIFHSACLQAGWLLSASLAVFNQTLHLPSPLWQVTPSSTPCLSCYGVSQTQEDTFETDKDVAGSGRPNVGVLEGPTVIPNCPSGRLNSMLSLSSQTCHTVRDLYVNAPIQP